jgi:hypothetical protein
MQHLGLAIAVATFCCGIGTAFAYTQPASVMDSGGGVSTSPGYENLGSIGQPIIGLSTGPVGSNHAGFIPVLGAYGILWPIIGFDPATFTFTFFFGEPAPSGQALNLSNTGGSTLEWLVARTQGWLTLTPLSGIGQGSVTVGVVTTALTPGVYTDTITISATGAENSGVTIPVTLTVHPDYTLTLTFASPTTPAGGGYITVLNAQAIPPLITCTGSPNPCTNLHHEGATLELTAYPNDDSLFAGWSGACSSANTKCYLVMDSVKGVTATFNFVKPAMIEGTTQYYDSLQLAYNAALTGQTIRARKFTFAENLTLDQAKAVTVKGGYAADYVTQPGYSLLRGKLIVGKGSLVTERLTVK